MQLSRYVSLSVVVLVACVALVTAAPQGDAPKAEEKPMPVSYSTSQNSKIIRNLI